MLAALPGAAAAARVWRQLIPHAGLVHMQVSSRLGAKLAPSVRSAAVRPFQPARAQVVVRAAEERLRLNNLKPAPGSRRKELRKGRGHAAGQVRAMRAEEEVIILHGPHTATAAASSRRSGCRACTRRVPPAVSATVVRSPAPAPACALALRVARCPSTGVCPSCAVLQEVRMSTCKGPSTRRGGGLGGLLWRHAHLSSLHGTWDVRRHGRGPA